MDIWVQAAQLWLNDTFDGEPGYVSAPTTGVTGWPTMYSLTRALQIELGISSTSDNFGPTTMSLLTSVIGNVKANTQNLHPNVTGILQCALWCKGYWGGANFGVWDADVTSSVASVRTDLGLSTGNSVPPKVFKSLLTMDAYVRIWNGTDKVRDIQRWLNNRYWTRENFPLLPCDGIYSRQVQIGLLYAVQYEIGMSDSVANGFFGPGTQQGIRDYGIFSVGKVEGSRKMVSLFQAALNFNTYTNTPFTGTFDATSSSQTTSFQSFVELVPTGAANYSTWASLLASSGDTNRSATGLDTSTPLNATAAAQRYSAGYRYVGRYINGGSKRIQPTEAGTIWAAGLRWFPIYQESNNAPEEFSGTLGSEQGERVIVRLRQLGVKSGNRVYLAVDYDATDDDIDALLIPHFTGAADAFSRSKSVSYRLGAYGTRNVCTRLSQSGLSESSFVSDMSTGYSGNLGFLLPANWAYDQIENDFFGSGAGYIEMDRDVASVRAEGLSGTDMVRTPRTYSGSTITGFDEEFYWKFVGLTYLAEATSNVLMDQRMMNDFVLNRMQKPTYWVSPDDPTSAVRAFWTVAFTPPISASLIEPARTAVAISNLDFESTIGVVNASFDPRFTMPALSSRLGDTAHWAASTRGFNKWGVPSTSDLSTTPGDYGSWALDLVSCWNSYEWAREDVPGGGLSVHAWMVANIGVVDATGFGAGDLRADMAAFLCASAMAADPGRPVDDIVRELLVGIEDNPGYLAQRFISERFGSRSNMIQAAMNIFSSPAWPIGDFALSTFLKVRAPGETPDILPPSSTVLDAELLDLATAFADAVENAQHWTER